MDSPQRVPSAKTTTAIGRERYRPSFLLRKRSEKITTAAPAQSQSAADRGYDPRWYSEIRPQVRREESHCYLCGQPVVAGDKWEVDHLQPFKGINDPLRTDRRNLRLAHKSCHSRKTASRDGGFGNAQKRP